MSKTKWQKLLKTSLRFLLSIFFWIKKEKKPNALQAGFQKKKKKNGNVRGSE